MPEDDANKGPFLFESWRARISRKELKNNYEFPIYSDVSSLSKVPPGQYGPCLFLDPGHQPNPEGDFHPVLNVRYWDYFESLGTEVSGTDTKSFHGGGPSDEVAALVSLMLGIRTKPGPITKTFSGQGGSGERPIRRQEKHCFPRIDSECQVIPNAVAGGPRAFEGIELFDEFFKFDATDANALMKSARSYQKALLVSEDDPTLSWLFLVTAIEGAAKCSINAGKDSLELYSEMEPEFSEKLRRLCPNALEMISDKYAELSRNTWKFIEFMMKYHPSAPDKRPKCWAQLDWTKDSLNRDFKTIYKHRSVTLHEGTPFPDPMCMKPPKTGSCCWETPIPYRNTNPNIKKPPSTSLGGKWSDKDLPMFLNTFEYIARKSLLKWWGELKTQD